MVVVLDEMDLDLNDACIYTVVVRGVSCWRLLAIIV